VAALRKVIGACNVRHYVMDDQVSTGSSISNWRQIMNLKLSRKWVASLAALAVLAAGSATLASAAVAAPVEQGNVLKFDIAENGKKFSWDETPLHPDGKPA
jgi:hypothetical protein